MVRRIFTFVILSALFTQAALADSVTYRQLQPDTSAAFTRLPAVTNLPTPQGTGANGPKDQTQGQGARAQESINHPEFVRLPDGRIVKYGPGIICDENCVDAMPLARSRVSRSWYVLPPVLAAGILCAVLCRGGGASDVLAGQPPVVLQPSPSPTIAVTPTPPAEVPEPSTLVLLTVGLGALWARRKRLNQMAE